MTVPSHFDFVHRGVLTHGAALAGLKVRAMCIESTAAALAYGLDLRPSDSKVFVLDLGGGTCDVTILEIGDGVYEVKATTGDMRLGGEDFDNKIIEYLFKQFQKENGIDLSKNSFAKILLKEKAEQAKIELSGLNTAHIFIPNIYADIKGIKHLDVNLKQNKFKDLTESLIERILECCREGLTDSGWTTQDIDTLILAGLSTKIPLVRETITRMFGRNPQRGLDPDEAVALGAAIYGKKLTW